MLTNMTTVLLIISALLFIATFGIYMNIRNTNHEHIGGLNMSLLPWISGFILPIIPFTLVFEVHWLAVFVLNIVVVYVIGPAIARAYLVRFSSGFLKKDVFYSFVGGLVVFIIGLMLL
jgi:hypothetical protein